MTKETAKKTSIWNRLGDLAFRLGLYLLALFCGIIIDIGGLPPAPLVRDAFLAANALIDQYRELNQEYSLYLWRQSARQEKALAHAEPTRCWPGYTLYRSGHQAAAILVDINGREVHRWTAPFSTICPDPQHIATTIGRIV